MELWTGPAPACRRVSAPGGSFAGQLETQRVAAKASQDAYLRSNHEAFPRARWRTPGTQYHTTPLNRMEVMFKNEPLQMCMQLVIIFRVTRTVIPCSFVFTIQGPTVATLVSLWIFC